MTAVASQINIEKALAIGGWMSERELIWLATQAITKKSIVEFGSFHGRSTRALCDNTSGIVWAVDPWNGDYYFDSGEKISVDTFVYPYFCQNLRDHIQSGRLIPHRGFSYSFKLEGKVDMVFIDGDHRYETVLKDIKKAYELLHDGGLICGHDYNHPDWPGVKQAVTKLIDNFEVEHTIWYTKVNYGRNRSI